MAAFDKLQEDVPNGKFESITCDLQDFASVRRAIDAIKMKQEKLDILCNNAGVMALPDEAASFSGPRWERYHQTKLANCAFTYGLQKKLEEKGITNVKSLLAHPGLAQTSLQSTTAAPCSP